MRVCLLFTLIIDLMSLVNTCIRSFTTCSWVEDAKLSISVGRGMLPGCLGIESTYVFLLPFISAKPPWINEGSAEVLLRFCGSLKQ